MLKLEPMCKYKQLKNVHNWFQWPYQRDKVFHRDRKKRGDRPKGGVPLQQTIFQLYALFCFQLKTSVDQQIKAKDEEIAKKMGISADAPGPPKSPKPKGKKGK